jgi:hypothetical protein
MQFQADVYYFYVSCIFLPFFVFSGAYTLEEFDPSVNKEELHNLNGLVNEVMSSASTRTIDPKIGKVVLEESIMLTIIEVNLQKLLKQ